MIIESAIKICYTKYAMYTVKRGKNGVLPIAKQNPNNFDTRRKSC